MTRRHSAVFGGLGLAVATALGTVGYTLAASHAGAAVEPIVVQFTTVGASQFDVPADICTVHVDALGASGGNIASFTVGGLGGEAQAALDVTPGDVLQVNVGGKGQDGQGNGFGAGGANGGGDGGAAVSVDNIGGGGGGGATDVRTGAFGLDDRVVVAGGGGGAGNSKSGTDGANGGNGGGSTGDPGHSTDPTTFAAAGGGGGTQSANGIGGTNPNSPSDGTSGTAAAGGTGGDQVDGPGAAGGGGGGLFGGGGGASNKIGNTGAVGGGGGGSGFTPDGSGLTTGVHSGDGAVTISYDPDADSCPQPPASTTLVPTTPSGTTAATPVDAAPRFTG